MLEFPLIVSAKAEYPSLVMPFKTDPSITGWKDKQNTDIVDVIWDLKLTNPVTNEGIFYLKMASIKPLMPCKVFTPTLPVKWDKVRTIVTQGRHAKG